MVLWWDTLRSCGRVVASLRGAFASGQAVGVTVALMTALCAEAQGPATTPLQVCAQTPILNEFGDILPGHFHSAPGERALVQVLWATNGVIQPPQTGANYGQPHPDNALMEGGETGIGALVSPSRIESGLFSATFGDPRPLSGKIFVRAFNASTLEDSLFYADSQIMDVTAAAQLVLIAEISATTNVIDDARDSDGDGLPDWWEHLNFGHATAVDDPEEDADGDGMAIWKEYAAGTDPNDDESFLNILRVIPDSNNADDAVVEWYAVPGRVYRVQFAQDDLAASPAFEDVTDDVTATADVMKRLIPGGMTGDLGHYRVRLVEGDGE